MAKTRITSRLANAVTAFARVRLPPDFTLPQQDDSEVKETGDKGTRCCQAVKKVPGFHFMKVGRGVEDPAAAILIISAISAEALESLLETQQYKDCLAALGLEQPPHHFTTDRYVSHVDIKGRMTIATLSFAYPATPEQREAFPYKASRVPVPGRFYEARNPMARGARAWVCGPQKLPDGREVENGLDFQPWRTREMEDVAAGEEREMRERWMSAIARRLGLLAVSVDRYDMYSL